MLNAINPSSYLSVCKTNNYTGANLPLSVHFGNSQNCVDSPFLGHANQIWLIC